LAVIPSGDRFQAAIGTSLLFISNRFPLAKAIFSKDGIPQKSFPQTQARIASPAVEKANAF
jgi:hypothetical protein